MIQQVCLFLGSIDRLERVVYKSAKLLRIAVPYEHKIHSSLNYNYWLKRLDIKLNQPIEIH